MFPLGLLIILLCALNCLVTSAPSAEKVIYESRPGPQWNHDIFPFSWNLNFPLDTVDKQSRKPKIEYMKSGKESSFNNPTNQWNPYSFNNFPPLNVQSQTMLPYPEFRLPWPTWLPFAPMDTQNFPTLPPLSEMDENNFPSLPLFPSKDKRPFPTLPPRNGPNNRLTLPPLGPFPTLPPMPPFPTQKFPTLPPLPPLPPFPTQNFPTLPPFSLLGRQNNVPKEAPLPFVETHNSQESPSTKKPYDSTEDSINVNFQESPSTKKPYNIKEESVNIKITFNDSHVDDKKETLQSNLVTHRTEEKTSQESPSTKKPYMKIIFPEVQTSQNTTSNKTAGINVVNHIFNSFFPLDELSNKEDESYHIFPEVQTSQNTAINKTAGINVVSHIFKSFFPLDELTNKEDVPVDYSLLDISALGVPLKCSKGRCFCPHLHYYDNHSGRCMHQYSYSVGGV